MSQRILLILVAYLKGTLRKTLDVVESIVHQKSAIIRPHASKNLHLKNIFYFYLIK
jgi:hypothetical protein